MATFKNTVTGNDDAVMGVAVDGRGVVGISDTDYGVRGHSKTSTGIRGTSDGARGVEGWAANADGVAGFSTFSSGVVGESTTARGVLGLSHGVHGAVVGVNDGAAPGGNGGWFESARGEGVRGIGHGPSGAVVGVNDAVAPGGPGGWFESTHGEGVRGLSKSPDHGGVVGVNDAQFGVYGSSNGVVGVWGTSISGEGVHADTRSTSAAALVAIQLNEGSGSAALYARHMGQGTAAFFEGNVVVTGDISLSNADCAEDFDVAPECMDEPGTVMVLDSGSALRESAEPYDNKVVGVVSGAGDFRPGLVLDRQPPGEHRRSIALLGKVFCKADAGFGAIGVGDLLTTSSTPGHAMRVGDPARAFGAVIGKAMEPLARGRGLIPILIALQ